MRVGVWIAIALIACGPTAAEIKLARDATYAATPADVFALAEQETARAYPIGERMPEENVFATVPQWFTDAGRQSHAAEAEQKKAGNLQLSFAILVTAEGSGTKVLVTPSAIDYLPGKPEPRTLDETALPKWIIDRANKLRVQIHKRVQAKLAAPAAK